MEVNRTHIEEDTELRQKASPHLESSSSKKKWNTKEHITSRNGDRHEKNEQQLDRTGKERSRQNSEIDAILYTTEEHLELNCQPTPKSEFSIQMSRQFYCMGRKRGELPMQSSRRYKCLLTSVYAKHFTSVGRTLSETTYCGREQTRSQRWKKSGRSVGS
ncbi:unnamed protein product [Schistosoma margrebowiei]|uniref:Uncharacterized protein n=1 Tax=Schistosoma margrebowiei TaxID=48269 RepID=A0A3P7XA89_9TREM|nr:unnamed protein product [Schistosoma margrebowiei]